MTGILEINETGIADRADFYLAGYSFSCLLMYLNI